MLPDNREPSSDVSASGLHRIISLLLHFSLEADRLVAVAPIVNRHMSEDSLESEDHATIFSDASGSLSLSLL